MSHVRTTLPFVGRKEQLAWLEQCLQETIAGHPHLVLIPGESGIGKTRLIKELWSLALRHHVQVGYGHGYEDFSLPYLTFIEALRLPWERIPDDVKSTLGVDAEIMSQFLQQESSPRLDTGSAPFAEAHHDKMRLFLTLSRTVVKLAQHGPMLFIVDDLHWADQPSLDVFGHLVFAVADAAVQETIPLCIIGTYRPDEADGPLTRLLARFQREDICQTVHLFGFDEAETYELIHRLCPGRPSHQLVATIGAVTQGNPLFIQEIVHSLIQQGALLEREGYVVTVRSLADLHLPTQITSALRAHIQGLSARPRHILTLAAFLGDHFSLQLLGAVSQTEEDELLDLLEEGIRQGLLFDEGQTFQFTHPLIRQAFYHEPNLLRRQRLHLQIAQTLEHLYTDNLDMHILEIAYHMVRVGSFVATHKVVQYARWAGDRAFAIFAWGDAAHYYETLLSAAEPTGLLSVHEQADIRYRTGLAYYRNGDVRSCLEHFDKAIEVYRQIQDLNALAQVLMENTRVHYRGAAAYGTLVNMQPLGDVLEALGQNEPELRGNIAATMSQGYWVARRTDEAEMMARQALDIGQSSKDDRLCAHAFFALGLAQAQSTHVQEALESWQNAVLHAEHTNDLWLQHMPLQRIPIMLIMQGRLDEAEAVALKACEVSRQTHDWANYSIVLSFRACVAVARGDVEAVEQYARETTTMMYRSGYPWGGIRALYALACARASHGSWAASEEPLDMLLESDSVFERTGPVIQIFAQTFRQLIRAYSRTSDATIESLAQEVMKEVKADGYSLAPLCALIEIGDLMANPAMVDYPYQELSRAMARGVFFSPGWIFLIPRVLGVAATLNGWWNEAEPFFQAAIETALRVGARPELGRSYLDYARMLAARGSVEDRRRAVELVQLADPILNELGMRPFVQQAVQLAQTLQSATSRSAQQNLRYSDRSYEKEGEALIHIAQSYTRFLG